MKILHTVCVYNPHLSGNQQVIQQLSERLVRRGHEVTVLTAYDPRRDFEELNGVRVEQFNISGTKAVGISGEKERYQKFLLNSEYDVIMNYGTNVWTTDLTFDLLPHINAAKILVPVGYTPLASPIWRIIYWKYYRELPKYMQQYDQVVYVSAEYDINNNYSDKNFGDKHGIKNYSIIPNAVSEGEFATKTLHFRDKYGITTPFMLLTVGYHQKVKGHSFIIEAFGKLSRKDVTLVIIGNDTPSILPIHSCYQSCLEKAKKSNGSIKVFTDVPRKDTISAFFDADIYLLGSKYECSPIVLLEAMASKTPFISTNVGNVAELEGGMIVNKPEEMTHCINELLSNPLEKSLLAEAGYQAYKEKYTWKKVTEMYENLYLKLVQSKSR